MKKGRNVYPTQLKQEVLAKYHSDGYSVICYIKNMKAENM